MLWWWLRCSRPWRCCGAASDGAEAAACSAAAALACNKAWQRCSSRLCAVIGAVGGGARGPVLQRGMQRRMGAVGGGGGGSGTECAQSPVLHAERAAWCCRGPHAPLCQVCCSGPCAALRPALHAVRCVASESAAQSEPRSAARPVPLQPRNGRRAPLARPVPLRASPAPRPRCRAAAKTTNRKRGDAARRPIGGGRGGARRSRAAVSRGRMRAGRGGRGRRAGSAGTPQSAPCGALLPAAPPAAPGRARSPSLAAPRKARPLPQCTVRSLSDSPAAPRAPNAALPHPAAPAAPPRSAPQSLQPTHIAACSPHNPPIAPCNPCSPPILHPAAPITPP